MSIDGKKNQKLPKIENETKKSTQTPLTEHQECFKDDNNDEHDQTLKNKNIKTTGLEFARSSCADDILMKTLIVKYTRRLMDKLEKIAVNVPDDSEHAESVSRLRRKIQRLLKSIDQVGGPNDSSTVLLNKYDCLRIAYYSLADSIKSTKRLPLVQGVSSSVKQLKTNNNCEKLNKSKESENYKKLGNQEKRNNCINHDIFEKIENCENKNFEYLMTFETQELLNKCTNCKNYEKLENLEKFQNCEKPNNLEKKLLNCEYCGRGISFCNMRCDPKLHSHRGNYQKNFIQWKSFLKRRFFIYFPCICCMCNKSV